MAAGSLQRGRASFEQQQWEAAFTELSAADREHPLEPDDLQRAANAAYLTGRDADSTALWERGHHELLAAGQVQRAVRFAFWLAFCVFHRGEIARGAGWLARAQRLLDEDGRDCVEQGYLMVPAAIHQFDSDVDAAGEIAARAAAIADRFGEPDLRALAVMVQGRTLLRRGRIAEGMAVLDEAMVAVTAGEVSAVPAGDVYCSAIEACQEIFDLRRAREWTSALTHWCEGQPGLVLYGGQCMVHRAEIMQLHGSWPDAVEAADEACRRFLAGPNHPAVGSAFYQRGELHRLYGQFDDAEAAYRQASRFGCEPQPGLSLLRLAQGHLDAAAAAIGRVLDEARGTEGRSRLLPVQIEIMLATGDLAAARAACDELSSIAAEVGAPLLQAAGAQAEGSVALTEGDPRGALSALRRAWSMWQQIEVPHQAARARVLIGQACRELGDEDGAQLEFDAACWVFQQLGAAPELARVQELARQLSRPAAPAVGGLTPREVEVLRLVAAGKTNRSIATELFLSEKTVARHLSNIFGKLGLQSRSAATAYAYANGIV